MDENTRCCQIGIICELAQVGTILIHDEDFSLPTKRNLFPIS